MASSSDSWAHGLRPLRTVLPGLGICGVVALAAQFLAAHYGAPVMLFALLLGLALNFLSQEGRCIAGIAFVARHVLRLGVALLGLRITAAELSALGWWPVLQVLLAVAATIGFGVLLARLLGFRVFFGLLTGGAVAICGASAALALAAALPEHPQKERATLFTVIGVSALSTLAMVLYPLVVRQFGLDAVAAGQFLGGTIHDVAQVVGAGYSHSQTTGDMATLVKLLRVATLLPVILLATWLTRRHLARLATQPDTSAPPAAAAARPPWLPGFVLVFVALAAARSFGLVPTPVAAVGSLLSQACLVLAMAAIGMQAQLRQMVTVGWRPVVLMLGETLFLALLFLGMLLLQR